ncbi:MAG: hypothetical protein H7318_19665, partial [Oligoflexus sp.]|nr:hypothetical protein [Oligoflexus sp.]
MRVRILGFALLPGLTLTLRSCKTSQSSHGSSDPSEPAPVASKPVDVPHGLGMNDVSILFPNHQNPAFLEQMPSLAD